MSEAVESDVPENIEFLDGAIKFKHKNAEYVIQRPSALESVRYTKDFKAIDKEDIEKMVLFYLDTVQKHGLPKEVAEKLDLFSLGDVFKALNAPAVKKK